MAGAQRRDLGYHRIALTGFDVRDVDLNAPGELRQFAAELTRAKVFAESCKVAHFIAECGLDHESSNVQLAQAPPQLGVGSGIAGH